ncbi:MAG TPA: hypothetical protein PKH01_00240, partial [Pseudomonadales bacterium]|nr:hypothetical protein [Pseudomonadales bacterium]
VATVALAAPGAGKALAQDIGVADRVAQKALPILTGCMGNGYHCASFFGLFFRPVYCDSEGLWRTILPANSKADSK